MGLSPRSTGAKRSLVFRHPFAHIRTITGTSFEAAGDWETLRAFAYIDGGARMDLEYCFSLHRHPLLRATSIDRRPVSAR